MIRHLPGFREFYPDECAKRNHLFRKWREVARLHQFVEYDAPALEPLELYTEKSGDEIVEQLFHFTDKGGREVALRPEMTPSLARMVGACANSLKRPVKWFSIGENYRYERQQKGRLRAFYQFNADIIGEHSPHADAACIALAIDGFEVFGLGSADIRVRLSDRLLWSAWFRQIGVPEDKVMAVLRVVDKMERLKPEAAHHALREAIEEDSEATLSTNQLIEAIESLKAVKDLSSLKDLFAGQSSPIQESATERISAMEQLLSALESFGLEDYVQLDMGIVRGLAYYTGFVFEVFSLEPGERALAGGGRYDHLLQKMGGPDLPAVGFAIGDVTLHDLLERKKRSPQYVSKPDVYLVMLGEQARNTAYPYCGILRRAGYSLEYPIGRLPQAGKQLKAADQVGASLAIIFGDEEIAQGTVKLRDLRAREEKTVPSASLLHSLRQFYEKGELTETAASS